MKPKIKLVRCVVLNEPTLKKEEKSTYYSFAVLDKKQNKKYTLTCFDDAREKNAFKAIEKIKETSKFMGKTIDLYVEVSSYQKKILSDNVWNAIHKVLMESEEKLKDEITPSAFRYLSMTENPTSVTLPSYKVLEWEFSFERDEEAVLRSKKKPIKPIMNLSQFEGGN